MKGINVIEESRFLSKGDMTSTVGGINVCSEATNIYLNCPGSSLYHLCALYDISVCYNIHADCLDYADSGGKLCDGITGLQISYPIP